MDDTTQMLVRFIVANTGLASRLLTEHVNDDSGYCRACAHDARCGYHRYPCAIAIIARRAYECGGVPQEARLD